MEKFYRRGRKTRETFDRNSSLPSERGLKLRLYPFPERISKSPFRFLQCSPKRSRPLEESVAGKEHATTEPIRRCFVPVVTRFYDPFTRAVSLIERNKITSHLLFIITPVALHISRIEIAIDFQHAHRSPNVLSTHEIDTLALLPSFIGARPRFTVHVVMIIQPGFAPWCQGYGRYKTVGQRRNVILR